MTTSSGNPTGTVVAETGPPDDDLDFEAAEAEATAAAANSAEWRRRHLIGTVRYVVLRVLRALLTIFVVATATFFLVRLLPGSPLDVYINEQVTQYGRSYEEAAAAAAALFSFDPTASPVEQYLSYLGGLIQGDLGSSITAPGTPVMSMIGQYLPWTLFSVGIALVISFVAGVGLGMVMAYRRGGWFDHLATAFGSVTQSIPSFLLAIMLIVILGVKLGWLPLADMRGAYTPGVEIGFNLTFVMDALFHAALPIWCYILTSVGGWMLVMKASTRAGARRRLRPGGPGPRPADVPDPVPVRRPQRDAADVHLVHAVDRLPGRRLDPGRNDHSLSGHRPVALRLDQQP